MASFKSAFAQHSLNINAPFKLPLAEHSDSASPRVDPAAVSIKKVIDYNLSGNYWVKWSMGRPGQNYHTASLTLALHLAFIFALTQTHLSKVIIC